MRSRIKLGIREFYDEISQCYDNMLNSSIPSGNIRAYLQNRVLKSIKPGEHLLEIGCGTGTDAVVLANSGILITATDISPNMLKITAGKALNENLTDFIKTELVDADCLNELDRYVYDGIISNLNALNYVKDLDKFSLNTSDLLKPGAKAYFVMLNKVCLWEIFYNLLKLKPITAFEKLIFREKYFKTEMRLYFPRKVKKIFSKQYCVNKITGFGFLYPPDGLAAFQQRHIKFFNKFKRIEEFLCSAFPFYYFCDHYLIEMTRK